MFSTNVYRWNSVDIFNGGNGISRTRGIVVDKTENGLLVDFGIANKEPQLTAFGRLIRDDEPTDPNLKCADGYRDCGDYEVLLQLSDKQPWTWYPAEFENLADSRPPFVQLKAEVSGCRSITDVFRKTQVRCRRCAKAKSTVLVGDYLKEHVDVPYDDFVVTPLFRKLWTGKGYIGRTYPVGIVNNKCYFIRRRQDEGLDPSAVLDAVHEIMREITTNNRGHKRSLDDCENEDTLGHHIPISMVKLTINAIPYDVLRIVLSHLDAVELVRYRRVCSLWDLVITSVDFARVVIYDMGTYKNQDLYVLATLLKLMTQTTAYLIFTRRAKKRAGCCVWFRKSMEVARTILGQTGITIPTLVLADLVEADESDLLLPTSKSKGGSTDIFESLYSICQKLVLVRVNLLDLFGDADFIWDSMIVYQDLIIPYASIRGASIGQTCELRDALEPSAQQLMKTVDKDHIVLVSDWIDASDDQEHRTEIMKVVQTWEGDCRRLGPACTWKDMDVSSNLDRLHCVTVMCLLYAMEQDCRRRENYIDSDEEDSDGEVAGSTDDVSSVSSRYRSLLASWLGESDKFGSLGQDHSDESLVSQKF